MASVGEERGPLASEDEVDSEEEAELEEERRQGKEVSHGKKKRKAKRKVTSPRPPPTLPRRLEPDQAGMKGTVDSPARSWRAPLGGLLIPKPRPLG